MDFQEIVLLIIVIGSSIASSIIKANKKRKAAGTAKPVSQQKEEDTWRKFFQDEDEVQEQEEAPLPFPPAKYTTTQRNHSAPVPPPMPSPAAVSGEGDYAEAYQGLAGSIENFARKSASPAPKKTPAGKKYDDPEMARAFSEENDGGEMLIEDFDLRQAVIYSEILKPKFEE